MWFFGLSLAVACLLTSGAAGSRFLENDVEVPIYKVAGIPSIPSPVNPYPNRSIEALEGPAHQDSFKSEVIDQADPEFDMVSGGDECINITDAEAPYEEGFQHNAMGREIWTKKEKQQNEEAEKNVLADLKMQFAHADSDGDGCINRTEFKAVEEMEGPPPGFEAMKIMQVGVENFTQQMEAEDRLEFDSMDRNHDGKVSQQEAYHFAGENMPQADIDEQLLKRIFKEADTNGDNFLTFEEFLRAGQGFEGDGNETMKAKPMWHTSSSMVVKFRQQVLLGNIKTKRFRRGASNRKSQ